MITGRDEVVALLPAAGFGHRLQSDVPKQYLELSGGSVLDCTLRQIRLVPAVGRIILVVSGAEINQRQFPEDVLLTAGGDTRADSVRNGLEYIRTQLQHDGLVLVHDAARPCVRVADVNRLIDEAGTSEHGGILAIPVHDTMKRTDDNQNITATIDRGNVWRAVTPQLFMINPLCAALDKAKADNIAITDEASAMEYSGYRPRVVACAQDNLKITVPEDMALARLILSSRNGT